MSAVPQPDPRKSRHRRGLELTSILAASAASGHTAGHWLPHPIAVMVVIGALTAAVTAPFICPAPDPPEEDTRP